MELGVELKSIEDSGEVVRVQLVNHAKGGEIEDITYDYVVGADGAKGASRKLLKLPFVGETGTESFVVGDVIVEGLSKDVSVTSCR